jgi:PIN domain nuclease of toxin-antitoxin system
MLGTAELRHAETLAGAAAAGNLFVSAISCWEIGMLCARGRLQLELDARDWVERSLRAPGLSLLPLTPSIAVAASYLPGDLHGDPADRILVASARAEQLTLATRDQKILDYSSRGFLRTLAC